MSTLMIGDDGSGPRHYLDGRPIHAGDTLQMLIGGAWQAVRYESEWKNGSLIPRLLLTDGDEAVSLGPNVVLRWPGVQP